MRIFGRGGRPATAGAFRTKSVVLDVAGEGGVWQRDGKLGVEAVPRQGQVLGRRRPGMPAAMQDKLRERERARVAPPPLSTAYSTPYTSHIHLTPTTPSVAVGGIGGRGEGGGGPIFFPPSVAIPRATGPSHARPTVEDLVRQEVQALPDVFATDALAMPRGSRASKQRGLTMQNMPLDFSLRGIESGRRAAEGHDDLLAWFREQVVIDERSKEEEEEERESNGAEIWEGRHSMRRSGGRGGVRSIKGRDDGATRREGGQREEEGVMVWGDGGRGRLSMNILEVGEGESGLVGRGGDGVEGGKWSAGKEESEEERRERLLAILKSRELLKMKVGGNGEYQGDVDRGGDAGGDDEQDTHTHTHTHIRDGESRRWETEETLSGEEPEIDDSDMVCVCCSVLQSGMLCIGQLQCGVVRC